VTVGLLTDEVVIVTGSSSGIGEAIVRRFAAEGARVVVNSRTSREEGEAVAASIERAVYLQADVSREEECRLLIDSVIERCGRLDHLVNNAGTTVRIPHEDLEAATDEVWHRILDTNLLGTWRLCRMALPHLRRDGGGSILNITSLAGVMPTGSSIPYSVSKAALNHLTRLLALVAAPEVRVNAVAPGLIATPWTADWAEAHERISQRAPLRRSGLPADVAAAALLMTCSPYTTGEVLLADGGVHLL
jgi:ketoreductase RED2